MHKRLILLMFLSLAGALVLGQDPLKSRITVSFTNEPVNEALLKLSELSSYQLAFNPSILPDKQVTQNYYMASMEHILKDMLGNGYQYKVRGSYIIIQLQGLPETNEVVEIRGEVQDAETGEKLRDVSIYEVNRLTASLTSLNGSYNLASKIYGDHAVFAISKENYRDTLIVVDKDEKPDFFQVMLKPLKENENDKLTHEAQKFFRFLLGEKTKKHTRNVHLQERRWAQLSLVPGIGTNGFLGGQVSNQFSVNVIGGYAHSLYGAELAGVFNLERYTVSGFQAAGAFNIAGGPVQGVQMAGAFNISTDSVSGAQFAGAFNTSANLHGVQMAGAVNVARNVRGSQWSGGVNVAAGELRGVQATGAFNLSGELEGVQVAGAYNFASGFSGLQMAGAFNLAIEASDGVQIAGGFNHSGDFKGLQISGGYNQALGTLGGMQLAPVNYATRLNGIQIGVVNIAGRVEKGVMIGLINITKNGLLAVDLDYNDVTEYNASFKTGPKHFYTILTGGLSSQKEILSFGGGFGSQWSLGKKLFTGLELSTHTLLNLPEPDITKVATDQRLNLTLGYNFTRRLAVHGGPVLHFMHYEPAHAPDLPFITDIGHAPLLEEASGNSARKMWIGYRVAVRL